MFYFLLFILDVNTSESFSNKSTYTETVAQSIDSASLLFPSESFANEAEVPLSMFFLIFETVRFC